MSGFLTALLGLTEIGSIITGMNASRAAANAQAQAVKTQALQQQFNILKQQNKEAHQVHEQLAINEMMVANRGLSMASPSFNAIQRDTLVKAQEALQEGAEAANVVQLSESAQIKAIRKAEQEREKQQIMNVAKGGMELFMGVPPITGNGGSGYGRF